MFTSDFPEMSVSGFVYKVKLASENEADDSPFFPSL